MSNALTSALAAAAGAARRDPPSLVLLDAQAPDTAPALAALAADPTVVVVDELGDQLAQLVQGRAPRERLAGDECRAAVQRVLEGGQPAAFGTWVFYPGLLVVHVLPAPLHHELRLIRNRYAITVDEQRRLAGLCVAVAGLSVGRAVVSTMAHEGIGGELRLADFDVLDLDLNRVAGGVADVGVNKVVLAAREVAELDPYVRVVTYPQGVDENHDRRLRRGCRRDRRRMRRPRDEGPPARARPRRPPPGRDGHQPSRDARRGALRDPARAPAVPRAAGRRHLRRARRLLTTKQTVPYVIRILDPGDPHGAGGGVDGRGQGVRLDVAPARLRRRPGRGRWWPSPPRA